jgi:S1-C subfamily serine protease
MMLIGCVMEQINQKNPLLGHAECHICHQVSVFTLARCQSRTKAADNFLHSPAFFAIRIRIAVKSLLCALLLCLYLPGWALGRYLPAGEPLSAKGAAFDWDEAKSKSLKILVEYRDREGNWKQSGLGSGFLISPDGLFITAYHVMQYCLVNRKETTRFSESVDCSTEHPVLRYKARTSIGDFEIELRSHLKKKDSINGKSVQTPDEIIKHRDFVVGKLKAGAGTRFAHWKIRDFKEGTVNLAEPGADFALKPLLPPRRVFIVGYPENLDFAIAHGFLNLAEDNHRGYFAADLTLYRPEYLASQGIPGDTQWGIGVSNHMSGGPVVDPSGHVVGIVVNGNERTAGVLSIENVLETFFSRSAASGISHVVVLSPTNTPLYLRE